MHDHATYPIGLRLAGRHVVIVGGGAVALRRAKGLLAAGAELSVVSPDLTPGLQALRAEFNWVPRRYQPGDLAGSWYAIAATDEPRVNATVAQEAEENRIFCARADSARESSAWTPAIDRTSDRTLAVWTGNSTRSSAWRNSLAQLDVPHLAASVRPGEVVLVGGGPGDPSLITRAGWAALMSADVVVADHLAPTELLSELAESVQVIDVAKLPRGPFVGQEAINQLLIKHARAQRRVVRLKGGDSFVFGRGGEEVAALVGAGVPTKVIPGISSAIAAPELAGIPVTHRGLAQEFTVVSGHLPPDHPDSMVQWHALSTLKGTLVVLMGVQNSVAIAEALLRHGRSKETPVAFVVDASSNREQVVTGSLQEVSALMESGNVRTPAVMIVGDVAGLAN
jgi:uroporphyrin-III C-methyltransferase / precorrin-2 dehydrogenase / sirohydrochlorin ferrochelatase